MDSQQNATNPRKCGSVIASTFLEKIMHLSLKIGSLLPLLRVAGTTKPRDAAKNETSYLITHRISQKCNAVLHIEGVSKGADIETAKAKEMGLIIYCLLEDISDAS